MVINSQIKQKRGGCKCCSPVLLHGKITMCRAGRPRNIIMWTEDRENLREEGDEKMNNSVTLKFRGGCLSVPKQGKVGQEKKYPSSMEEEKRKQRKGGKKKKNKLVNNKGKGRGETNRQ